MVIAFKYKSIERPDGNKIKTPSIPIVLIGKSGLRVEFMALIDSGADISVIPQDVAELLGLNLNGQKDKSRGIGGEVEVINTMMSLNLKKGHEDYNFSIPVQVILGENKVPVLLGREKFFDEFTIIFDQTNERILLKKANKKI